MCRLSVRLRVASLIFSLLSTHPVQSAPHSSFYLVTPLLPSGLCSNTPSQGGLLGHPTRPCPPFGALYPSSYSVCHTWHFMSLFTCLLHWNAGSMKASTRFCPLFSSPALGTQQWLNKHLPKEHFLCWFIHSGRLHLRVSENSPWSWWGIIRVFRGGSVRSWRGSVSEGVLRRKWLAVSFATGMKKRCQWLATE